MLIRPLEEADAAQFQALRLRGLVEEESAFASSHEEERNRPIEDIRTQLAANDSGAILGAFDGKAMLPVVGVQREKMMKLSHKGYIWGMYVAPERRARGLGTQILRAALDYAWTQLRVKQVTLGVHTENAAALRVYTALGFEIFGTERGALCVRGQYQDQHHMVCRAPSAA